MGRDPIELDCRSDVDFGDDFLLAAISLGYMAMMAIIARSEPEAWQAVAVGIVPLAGGLGFLLDFALIRKDLKAANPH